jgi:hypothetical protein
MENMKEVNTKGNKVEIEKDNKVEEKNINLTRSSLHKIRNRLKLNNFNYNSNIKKVENQFKDFLHNEYSKKKNNIKYSPSVSDIFSILTLNMAINKKLEIHQHRSKTCQK